MKGWATALTLLLLVQAMGLQLLCFCGHCPISHTLGLSAAAADDESAHSCCAKALDDQAAELGVGQATAGGECCGDQHQLSGAAATAQTQPDPAVAHPPLAEPLPPPFGAAALASTENGRHATLWARGPPGAAPPNLPIALHRLLI